MRQSTKPEDNVWLARCRYPDCTAQTIKCPECKKRGHITTHIHHDTNYGDVFARITILHAHFLENVDAGRNMYHETNYYVPLATNEIERSYRLKPTIKKSLITQWEKRLAT